MSVNYKSYDGFAAVLHWSCVSELGSTEWNWPTIGNSYLPISRCYLIRDGFWSKLVFLSIRWI